MARRKLLFYYAWSRPGETGAPLGVIENRFPTLFESRRMAYPRFDELSDPARFDQSVAGFLDHIMKRNFAAFLELADTQTGEPAKTIERVGDDGRATTLDSGVLDDIDTLVVISFDSLRTAQIASGAETEALRGFLAAPDHLAFVCPHHDIGEVADAPQGERAARQLEQFVHHGDKTIPPQQRFGGYAKSLLHGLGLPVENRFGLRPALEADGSPCAIEATPALDRLGLLHGVDTFNAHAHLPHFERLGSAMEQLDVLARQKIDPGAPPHPFAREHRSFDALLQSRADTFAGTLLVGDTTLWSSTAGGVDSLRRLWLNVLQRPHRH
ncbi:hypothetical protein NOV72_00041 [Caballeronia novacaledonica]|uniref:Uncharacterized protein n=1 Tax=Caballeronia novacaledonica TaxID=1544861 RepID=A0A2U3HY59_9BURK|nr:hypothetical protein [Caballeronia novacaledonica]SPB12734.1 hypothetical protein NOV72_00041 [Caballeronia novacaledonica]